MSLVVSQEQGKRFRDARTYVGYTVADVAKCLRISDADVESIEAGTVTVPAKQLTTLAKLYCRPPSHFTVSVQDTTAFDNAVDRFFGEAPELPREDIEELAQFSVFLRDRKASRS